MASDALKILLLGGDALVRRTVRELIDTLPSRTVALVDGESDDVTARLVHLEEIAERLRLLDRCAAIGLWDWEVDRNQLSFSPGFKTLFGYRDGDEVRRLEDWLLLVHSDDRDGFQRALTHFVLDDENSFEYRYRLRDREGSYRYVTCHGEASRDTSGRVSRIVGVHLDTSSVRSLEQQLVRDTFHDDLTGIPNRALFLDRLGLELARSRRAPSGFALLLVDVDRFTSLNHSLGHITGDQVLIAACQRIQSALRTTDTLARLGADEFAIILTSQNEAEGSIAVAQRIVQLFAEPLTLAGRPVYCSVGIGIALAHREHTQPDDILRDASLALRQAKQRGASQIELFDKAMHNKALNRLKLEVDLRRALDHNEMALRFQPIVDLRSQRVMGFEALVRWLHPEQGEIGPLSFIPLAERTGLIVPLGEWIATAAAECGHDWAAHAPAAAGLELHINVAAAQLARGAFSERMTEILLAAALPFDRLWVEITESALIDESEQVRATLEHMRQLGARITLDDFGTGYSSLSYLHRFPLDGLKIDKSFVRQLGGATPEESLVDTVLTIARRRGLAVVAEGVETQEQETRLLDLGCEAAQGFRYAHPMTPEEVVVWLETHPDLRVG